MLASIDTCVHIWEPERPEPSYDISLPINSLQCATFLKDPRKLFVGGKNSDPIEVDIYNRKTRKCVLDTKEDCCSVCVNEKGDLIVVGTFSGRVVIISYPELTIIATYDICGLPITAVSFLSDDRTAICGDSCGHLMKFNETNKPKDFSKLSTKNGAVYTLVTLPSGDVAAVQGRSLYIYDFFSEEVEHIYDIGSSAVLCSHKALGDKVLIGTHKSEVEIYDCEEKEIIATVEITDVATALAIAPDGRTVTASYIGGIDTFDIDDPENVQHFPTKTHDFAVALTYQPEAIAIPDDAIRIADSTNPTQVYVSKADIEKSRTMRLSSGGYPEEEEEEDYEENKITFRRSLLDINEKRKTPGKLYIEKSSINETPKKRNIDDETDSDSEVEEKHVSGILTFSKIGSPIFKSKKNAQQTKIIVPDIDEYPDNGSNSSKSSEEKQLPSILNSPRETPTKNEDSFVIMSDSDESEDAPIDTREASICPDDISECNSPMKNKENDDESTKKALMDMNIELLKRLDEITARLTALEEKSNK